jgi:hypothetical protein
MKRYPPLAGAGGGQFKLIIEVDGYSHFPEEVILKDNIKEKALKETGYEVIRFTDTQLLKDIHNVIAEIEKNIEELERQDVGKFAKVHPQPPPAGNIAILHVSAKKTSFLLKKKIVNDHKNFSNQNLYSFNLKR